MKPVFLTILAICCFVSLQAQNTTTRNDSLMNRELTLEKEYNPTIQDAIKLSQLPELREPQAPKSKVEFSNYETPLEVQSRLIPLSPQAYLTHLNYSKYRGYLTAEISSLIDFNADLGYQILNSNQDRLNIFFSHRSSGSNVSYLQDVSYLDETGKQKFKINDNWGGLNYLHDFGGIKLNADLKYTYSTFNYYGLSIPYNMNYFDSFLPGPQPNHNFDKNTNQANQLFETHIGLVSDKANELNYKINAGYTNFRQKYGNTIYEDGSKENRILLDGDIHKLLSSTMGIGISGSIKTYSYGNKVFKSINDSTTNYWTYSVNPYLYWEDTNWNLLLGAQMNVEVGGRGKIIASPTIRLNYFPTNQFMFYLLADGGIKDNSQYNLYYENRYVDPLIRVADSRSPLDATVGIKFMPLPALSAGIFGGYKITKDEHFYYSNVGAKNYFEDAPPMLSGNWITPIYENANTVKLGADFKYAFQNIFEIDLKGTYYHWIISNNSDDLTVHKAWNKPDFEMNLNAAYCSPWIPLRFDLSYLGAFGRKATDAFYSANAILHMKNIHDLSVKATYSITSNFSVYGSLNNLLFSKYDFWWGYPAQGFNIMAGISILF